METGKTICEIALWTNWIHTGSMQACGLSWEIAGLGMKKNMEILRGKGGAKKDLKPIK